MTETQVAQSRRGPGRRRGLTLFRVRGVPVRVDLSWVLIAGFVVWIFAGQLADVLAPQGTAVLVVSAVATALLFFASILLHEFGHAFTSLDRGIPVHGISLFLLGGVTESSREARSARDEFVIVGVGPFISLVLAAAFGLLFTAVRGIQPAAAIAGYLAWLNLSLAVFNVLPGYPLDGGRLLRSVLWMATGSPHRSTRWAARVGQAFALLLLVGGVLSLLEPAALLAIPGPIGTTLRVAAAAGWWGALIGYFLLRGATDAYRRAQALEHVAGRTARQLMGSVPPSLSPDATLAEVVDRLATKPSVWWPVGVPVLGAVRLADLDAVAERDWGRTPVRSVLGAGPEVALEADTPLDEALARLAAAPGHMLIMTDHGAPVGLLTPSLAADV